MADDPDPIPPAGDDADITAFLDIRWREAMRSSRELMGTLRELVPEMRAQLPEVAYSALNSALGSAEKAYGELHRAGRHVIGEQDYKGYLETQVRRNLNG